MTPYTLHIVDFSIRGIQNVDPAEELVVGTCSEMRFETSLLSQNARAVGIVKLNCADFPLHGKALEWRCSSVHEFTEKIGPVSVPLSRAFSGC